MKRKAKGARRLPRRQTIFLHFNRRGLAVGIPWILRTSEQSYGASHVVLRVRKVETWEPARTSGIRHHCMRVVGRLRFRGDIAEIFD